LSQWTSFAEGGEFDPCRFGPRLAALFGVNVLMKFIQSKPIAEITGTYGRLVAQIEKIRSHAMAQAEKLKHFLKLCH
jgi:hypothetical protein